MYLHQFDLVSKKVEKGKNTTLSSDLQMCTVAHAHLFTYIVHIHRHSNTQIIFKKLFLKQVSLPGKGSRTVFRGLELSSRPGLCLDKSISMFPECGAVTPKPDYLSESPGLLPNTFPWVLLQSQAGCSWKSIGGRNGVILESVSRRVESQHQIPFLVLRP